MKKHFVLPLITIFLVLMSCKSEDYDIEEKLDDPKKELLVIETEIKPENIEIKNLDALIKGQEKKLEVVSYTQLDDKSGYKMTMSDGSDITLKNECKSVVGVKRFTDGSLYWTISGGFMFDANAKMIKAEGITPKLRLNNNNEWEISSDSGKTWQSILDDSGNTIFATDKNGKDGDNTGLKIEDKDNTIVIIYKGITYNVTKFVRPKLPIEYLTEYNVNIAGDGFCDSHDSAATGLFNWYESTGTTNLDYNVSNRNILSNTVFKQYHLGSHSEWRGILPDEVIHWGGKNQHNVDENISIAGKITNFKADYDVNNSNKVCYALRFKDVDNSMLSAYRYEYVDSPYDLALRRGCYEDFTKMISVKVFYLGKSKAKTTLSDISKEAFWDKSEENYITRIFPATGYSEYNLKYNKYGKINRRGEQGFYWTVTDNGVGCAISMNFYQPNFDLTKDAYNQKRDKYAIRLFSNK